MFHLYSILMRSLPPGASLDPPIRAEAGRPTVRFRIGGVLTALVAALVLAGCAEPPHKEMEQAQGAIDAARAAGAERYAPGEYTGAVDALRLAHAAVADGDYRLALNHALESRERAQGAAREAAETAARVRSEVEQAMASAEAGLARADAELEAAEPLLTEPAHDHAQKELSRIRADVQEAGAAIAAGDYLAARPLLDGRIERIEQVLTAIEEAVEEQTPQRQ